jgi:hypothetical protein
MKMWEFSRGSFDSWFNTFPEMDTVWAKVIPEMVQKAKKQSTRIILKSGGSCN